jgi:FkbH-like protein
MIENGRRATGRRVSVIAMSSTSSSGSSSAEPEDPILRLHRDGRLLTEYPRVRRLLDGLSGDRLHRAGRLLSRLDVDEVLRAHPDVPVTTIAITGHGTLDALVAPLTAETARHGLLLRPVVGDFDAYVFDLGDPGSRLYAAEPDLALCLLDPAVVFDEVPTPWRPDDVRRVLADKLALLDGLAARFGEAGHGTLVLNTIPLPRLMAAQLVDHRSRAALGALWREANARLLRLAETHPRVVVLDLDILAAEGVPVTDPRLSIYTRAHLTPGLLAAYAREAGHLARHLSGRAKKVLAIDLDGTAWGGVLGDDGPDGLEVADGHRGAAYQAFQRAVRQLAAQGVLVAVMSKNDVEPVRRMLREHPGMLLREDDVVRVAANWRPKNENLAELAEDLGIGVDAIVFVDDSPHETGLVRRELPEVTVVAVDEEPAWHVSRLLADGWFDGVELTAEDRERPALYRDELSRRDFLGSFTSVQDYLRELRITVRVAPAAPGEAGRLSQLTLRTNQFNLTTERLRPADVDGLIGDPDALTLAVHVADRFGDSGIAGAILARREGDVLAIRNFLLSCRVFGRGVEQAALSVLLEHARTSGATAVTGTYRRSPKNANVAEFYPRHGFAAVAEDGDVATFRHDLAEIAPPPDHITLTFGGSP